jgi:CelD/BcsL family acetyltransferase involved in cellulose biosynthesis
MEMTLVDTVEELLALRRDWQEIHTDAEVNHPFSSFDWTWFWWAYMRPKSIFSNQKLQVMVFSHRGKIVGIVPFFLTTFNLLLGGIQFLRPIGSDHNLTEIRPFLAVRGYSKQILQKLEMFLHQHRDQWHILRTPDMPLESVMIKDAKQRTLIEEYVLDIRAPWETFKKTRSRNMKEALRKCYNAPRRYQIFLDFEAVDLPDAIIAHLPDFFKLHQLRAAQAAGIRHPDYFSTQRARSFLSACIHGFVDTKPIFFLLRDGQGVIAARLGFVVNKSLYLYFSGIDPQYAHLSIGTRLVAEIIQFAQNYGLEKIHLSTGKDSSKLRWGPDVHFSYTYVDVSPRFSGRVFRDVLFSIRNLKKRSDLTLMGLL